MTRVGELTRVRWLVGALLIAAAALFAIGVGTEEDSHDEPATSAQSSEQDEATEAGEQNEAIEEGETSEATEGGEEGEESESDERVLGVDVESTPLVVLAIVISIALAAATWRTDHKLILLVTALFSAAFAVLDVAELIRQIEESAVTIAVIAAVIVVLHVAAALLALQRRASMA